MLDTLPRLRISLILADSRIMFFMSTTRARSDGIFSRLAASLYCVPVALSAMLTTIASPAWAQQSATTQPVTLTLQDALAKAGVASEAVAIARAGELRAKGQHYQARSALLPQLSASFAWQKTLQNQFNEISKRAGAGSDAGDSTIGDLADNPLTRIFASPYTTTFGLQATQTVFTGGRATAMIRAAQAGKDAAKIGTVSALAQVQLDVTQAFFDAMLADRLVAIAESSLVQTERTLQQVRLTRQVGSASEFDLIRAQVTRDNQRPQFLQARTQRDLAYQRLRQMLEFPESQPLSLVDQAIESLDQTPVPVDQQQVTSVNVDVASVLRVDPAIHSAVDRALANVDTSVASRSSVRQAERSLEIAKQQHRATRAQRLPTLGLVTNYQRLAYPTNGFPASLNDFFPNWTAGVQVSFPFFTGGRVRGEMLASEAAIVEAEQRLKQTQEGASLDVQQTVAQYREALATWQASQGTTGQAARAYQIAEVRFKEGISTQLELAETRVQLQQAQANSARAARDLQVARVRLQLLRDLPLGVGSATGAQPSMGASAAGANSPLMGNTMQSGNNP